MPERSPTQRRVAEKIYEFAIEREEAAKLAAGGLERVIEAKTEESKIGLRLEQKSEAQSSPAAQPPWPAPRSYGSFE
jgi:hypothetical protein